MQAVAGQPGVSGYVLGGLGTGESPEQRQQIVQAVLQRLPAGAPRMLSSVGTPEEILEAVAQVRWLLGYALLCAPSSGGWAGGLGTSEHILEAVAQMRPAGVWRSQLLRLVAGGCGWACCSADWEPSRLLL